MLPKIGSIAIGSRFGHPRPTLLACCATRAKPERLACAEHARKLAWLDVTVANHLYVDGDSSVNVTAKGYLGGWHFSEDGGLNWKNRSSGLAGM